MATSSPTYHPQKPRNPVFPQEKPWRGCRPPAETWNCEVQNGCTGARVKDTSGASWAEKGRLLTQLPPPQVQSTLKTQGRVKKAREPRGGRVCWGRQSLFRCLLWNVSECLHQVQGVGGNMSRYEIAKSVREHCLCVCHSVCLPLTVCPLFSSLPQLCLLGHACSWPPFGPGPPRTMSSALFSLSPLLRLDWQDKTGSAL